MTSKRTQSIRYESNGRRTTFRSSDDTAERLAYLEMFFGLRQSAVLTRLINEAHEAYVTPILAAALRTVKLNEDGSIVDKDKYINEIVDWLGCNHEIAEQMVHKAARKLRYNLIPAGGNNPSEG